MNNKPHTLILTGTNARRAIVDIIANARESIQVLAYAISPQSTLDTTLRESTFSTLQRAPARRVQCRIVIARHSPTSPHEAMNTEAAAILDRCGWTVARYPMQPVMHAKMIIVDGRKVITGSHNLTRAALEHNRELSTLTTDPIAAADAVNFFKDVYRASTLYGTDQRPS